MRVALEKPAAEQLLEWSSLLTQDATAPVVPDASIEVDDGGRVPRGRGRRRRPDRIPCQPAGSAGSRAFGRDRHQAAQSSAVALTVDALRPGHWDPGADGLQARRADL